MRPALNRTYLINGRRLLPLVALMLLGLLAAAAEDADPDEKTLRDNKVATDGPGLLRFLRSRTLDDNDGEKLKALIRQLGNDSFREREKATAELLRYGRLALPFLRAGTKDSDAEIAHRSRRCIEKIMAGPGPGLPIAVLHRIARGRPEGAAEVLLRYLPFADDPYVEEETLAALVAVAVRGGEADPAIIGAIRDQLPLRRVAAARVLDRAKDAKLRASIRPLLTDSQPRVRLEAAHALLLAREKEAVPALIELLRCDSVDISYRAEWLLLSVAGDKRPKGSAGDGSKTDRRKWHDAWVSWWKARDDGFEVPRIDEEEQKLGFVMVAIDSGAPQVWEYGRDRKERWRLGGFSLPMDVRMLPGGNVLVADCGSKNVAEYDKSGKLARQYRVNGGPMATQRLSNRNTFVCTGTQLLELDPAGKEVVAHTPGGDTLTDAVRLANGNIVFINTRGVLKEITWPARKEVRTLRLNNAPARGTDWYRLEPGRSGRLLLASHTDGRVFEIDVAGKVIWEHKVPQAYSATRLANDNVLIATAESQRLIEVDRAGKIIHETKAGSVVRRVRAR
jgi:hypothetical protein